MIIYRYIDEFVNFWLHIFNFFSRLLMIFRPKLRKLLKNNRKMKNLKTCDECFILGNGPSLKEVDLSKLNDKDTFTVNMFYKYRSDGFKGRYFVAVDDVFAHGEYLEYVRKVYEDNPNMYCILRDNCFYENEELFDLERAFFIYAKQFQAGKDVRIECDKNMTACINVVLQCIQIALDMGYKRIYLLGCEFSEYAQSKLEHFYEDSQTDKGYSMGDGARWAALAHYHHYALDKYAREHGVEIINLTPNSLIDAYKKEKIENVIK